MYTRFTPSELENLYTVKQEKLLSLFAAAQDAQSKYQKIIELGKTLTPFPSECKIASNLVLGCQSQVYLTAALDNEGIISFQVGSDALISSGLAALLLMMYHCEPAELILHSPPVFIRELGLPQSLTPGRSNGLLSMFGRMKQETLKLFFSAKESLKF
jgi:sulfur transfer protein SufE